MIAIAIRAAIMTIGAAIRLAVPFMAFYGPCLLLCLGITMLTTINVKAS